MKRQSQKHWYDKFSRAENELLEQVIESVCSKSETGDELPQACEEIIEILDHINADFDTIAAAILLLGREYVGIKHIKIDQLIDEKIIALAEECHDLIQEESNWLAKIDGAISDETGSAHHMMLLSMMKDMRAVFILLAFQLLKMRNLNKKTLEKQKAIAEETQAIFAPLANRLGIGQLKWELEDLAFRYLQPDEYKKIAKALEERRVDREQYMVQIVQLLQKSMDESAIKTTVYGRPKHIYSIWKKMQKKNLEFSDLYDVRAVRILVNDLSTCYTALSVVHGCWQYIPSEYDDYIASPKANNYQSLHTAVLGPENKVVEIQIRTHEMHEHAELGVAAHWRYKEGGKHDNNLGSHLESIRNLLSDEAKGEKQIVNRPTRIYVLSPKGNVVELPVDGTPLDFAYAVHTEVGNKCRGAKINGKMSPLTTPLASGQTVEIITAKNATPSRDWLIPHLGYLKSSRAKSKVRHWFKREFREEHIASGKAALQKDLGSEFSTTDMSELAASFNMNHVDDLYAAIGRGELGVHQVTNTLKVSEEDVDDIQDFQRESRDNKKHGSIAIQGVDELLTSLARCCKPMPGDNVTGFITKGRGVAIHRTDCQNLQNMQKNNPERIVDINWGSDDSSGYDVDVEVVAMDRSGLLRDVTAVLSADDVNVNAANTYSDRKNSQARMRLTIEINRREQLERVLSKLINLRGVLSACRVK